MGSFFHRQVSFSSDTHFPPLSPELILQLDIVCRQQGSLANGPMEVTTHAKKKPNNPGLHLLMKITLCKEDQLLSWQPVTPSF